MQAEAAEVTPCSALPRETVWEVQAEVATALCLLLPVATAQPTEAVVAVVNLETQVPTTAKAAQALSSFAT